MNTAPPYLQESFIKALGKLPQRVLWKYENPIDEKSLENVMIRKWFPQRDILGRFSLKNLFLNVK